MIATAKVLRVRAREPEQVARAAAAVVAYVQGGQPENALAGYYSRDQARGRARGRLASLVGLRGDVTGQALARLLRGEHAVTGQPLLTGAGSAGRTPHLSGAVGRKPAKTAGEDGEWLTLVEAAAIAGVSTAYLRRLVGRAGDQPTPADTSADPTTSTVPRAGPSKAGGRGAPDSPGAATPDEQAGAGDVVAAGAESGDHLTGARGPDGRWRVRRAEFERWNARRVPPATVLGYDLVCAAPKSVSLLWAFGDDALRADIGAALDAAVDATIGYLERHAAFGLVAGRDQRSLGLAVASYLHDVSRNTEAHLHVHNIIFNVVAVPDDIDRSAAGSHPGQSRPTVPPWAWRTVDGEVLLAHIRTAGFVGAAVLRHELSRLRGVAWEPVRNGVAELAGFPPDLLAAFSTRHGEVEAEFAQLVAQGLEPSGATKAAAQRGSRKAKKVLADDAVHAAQLDRLTATGWTIDQVRQLAVATPDQPVPLGEREIADLFDLLSGALGLTEKATTFVRRDVVRMVAAWTGDRADAETIERLTDRFLADPRVVLLHGTTPGQRRRHQPEPLYSVEDLLLAEDTLSALIRQGQVTAGAAPRLLVDPTLLETRLAAATHPPNRAHPGTSPADPERRAAPVALSAEQAELVRRLLTSGDLVRPAVGPAGTGKTEAMRALTGILRAAGRHVFATAHGGRQAEELADRIGIPARVVASWLTLLDNVTDPADVWPPGSVLIVDEATQVATRDAERLLRYATRTGTVVLALGDPAQLGSVGAGGWFTHLVAHTSDVATLTTVHRQAGADLAPVRAALGALRADTAPTVRAALDRLAADGRIHLADGADALLERAVADWYAERQRRVHSADDIPGANSAGADAPTPATGARHGASGTRHGASGTRLGASGANSAPGANGGASVDGASRWPAHAAARPQPAKIHLMAERHREVETLNRAARALLTADGTLTGPALHTAGREFQIGDEVITLTQAGHTLVPAGKPGSAYVRTGTVGVVTAVHLDADRPAGQALTVYFPSKGSVRIPWDYLTHRFADGRDGGLAHAYAITAAKAQGTTMDTARAVVTDDTSRAGLYVMLSRARTDLAAYVVRRDQLDEHDDETWLPAEPGDDSPLDRLAGRLDRSRAERLASDHDPWAAEAHRLRRRHTLAELTAFRLGRQVLDRSSVAPTAPERAARERTAPVRADPVAPTAPGHAPLDAPTRRAGMPRQVLLRRAELAAEAALRAAALAHPPTALVARLGSRPEAGPERAVWDAAVGALAVYHARHQPGATAHDAGPPPGARPDDQARDPWLYHRYLAHRLVDDWAAGLPDTDRTRFSGVGQAVPRNRAVAGVHALLDAGLTPSQVTSDLAHPAGDETRAGAAVLAWRVTDLCEQVGVDPALYELPSPTTAQQEWNELVGLLNRAEITHLATRPTAALAEERQLLVDAPLGLAGTTRTQVQMRAQMPHDADRVSPFRADRVARLARVEAALDRQTTDAVLRATAEPASYLTALLGPRPTATLQAAAWEQAASRAERYRHHVLGLPYGTPAIIEAVEPARQALGDRPTDPRAADAYDQARDIHMVLDAQLPL
ncbi:MobF family relaxase [Frankia nepalensis]|uniref:MobF family relaxase n=1 Tax=Frankia nepalensis TaxID=1836974 RepID=UPI001934993E|nr:MobF family relaxase [Frankia nepalensis]MBL7508907.1 relaxase domain-containing protein [Frankia nepalensis]